MLEVEGKFRAADHAPVRALLAAWDATPGPVRTDRDHYFAAPDRDFAATDEAVRVRTTGPDNALTYKGPKRVGAATKTRTEIELPVEPGPDGGRLAVEFLTALRYRPVAVVEKSRQAFTVRRGEFDVTVCLDDIGAIGKFVEIEVLATEADFAAAEAAVLSTAQALGLTVPERRSYLELVLAQPLGPGRGPPQPGPGHG